MIWCCSQLMSKLEQPSRTESLKLQDIALGARARVTGYSQNNGYVAQLQRLGLVMGTEITVVRRAPLGDPIEISLRGFSLALRPSETMDLELQVLST